MATSGGVRQRARDVRSFLGTVGSFTDRQVKIMEVDWDELEWIDVNVRPNEGPFRGAEYTFRVKPNSLDVTPKSLILHPNIDKGKLCMIFDDAKEAPTLEASILAILYLLHNPDYFGASFEFRKCVPEYDGYRWIRLSLTGRQIVNFKGLKYIEDDQEITEILDDIEVYRLSKLNFAGIVEDEELEAFCEERKNKRAKNCENIVKTPHISPTTVEGKSGALSELEEIIYKKLEQYNDITEKYHDPTAVMSFYSFKQPITEQTFQPPDSYSESNVQNMARHSCRQETSSCKLQDL